MKKGIKRSVTSWPPEQEHNAEVRERQVTNLLASSSNAHQSPSLLFEPDSLPVSDRARMRLVQRARLVTYASLIFTLAGGLAGIMASLALDSAAVLGYALESFVDVWSSILVLWRFWDDRSTDVSGMALQREKFASFGISLSFLGISFVVGKEAIGHIQRREGPEEAALLLGIAMASVIVLSILCGLKLDLSRKLRSESLRKDAVTSGAVAVLSAAICISTLFYRLNRNLWWFDSVVALCISLALFCSGLWPLVSVQWWSKSFWAPMTDASLLLDRAECGSN
ncbi:g146 [Coccomyxa elongata]